MLQELNSAGSFTLPGTSLTVNRMGYGAMQLAGRDGNKLVWGPPRNVEEAIAVLREAVSSGVNHIDTSDFYGPHVTNQIIRQALHPYPDGLVIVTKVGARRGSDGSWLHARSRQEIISAVHDNLRNLALDALDVVNLRLGGIAAPEDEAFEEPLTALVDLQQQGLIRHIGLSNVTAAQIAEARRIVPFFPLGGFTPLQSDTLSNVASRLNATPMQVALAWLLHRSPNILVIPGTSSLNHLRENLKAAALQIPPDALAELDAITTQPAAASPARRD
jgi:aryl-alcohol dehydrogenase-like predicted oxidoreductase